MSIITFEEALELAGDKRHLMLGNGFSIALRPDIFRYGRLFEKANFSGYPEVGTTFQALGSEDFEEAVQALEQAAIVLPGFLHESAGLCARMDDCATKIKNVLVETIAGQHPARPGEVNDYQYEACLRFLNNFLPPANKGKVYTLNYDILLYWTLMHGLEQKAIAFDDGFRADPYKTGAEYVVWDDSTHSQNVYYLHGALHLFDGGHELQKYTWCRADKPLIEQVREAINRNLFPLFVAEGAWEKKLRKISHHSYLSKGQRSLAAISGALFLHGLSLAENDTHILRVIEQNTNIARLFIGLHGAPDSADNQRIQQRALGMATARDTKDPKKPLQVDFYDSASANVWG